MRKSSKAPAALIVHKDLPVIPGSTLLLALTGWMDGGAVSTGTVRQFMENRDATEFARIEPAGFYIENFPGSMDIAALFRPEVKYERGLITGYEETFNTFHVDEAHRMLFFTGREPNLNWSEFARCIFHVIKACKVARIVFVGSFGGAVPHTREPRLYGSVSGEHLLPTLTRFALKPSDYEGPGSFASHLLLLSPQNKVDMISIAAEIPGYLQGQNPVSIEAVARRVAAVLELEVDLSSLRRASTEWELKVSEAVEKDKELRKRVRKLEEEYDNELIADENT